MVGCMLGSSLSMAPALYVAQFAEFVDLDGPTMLSQDIRHGLTYQNGIIGSLPQPLWGGVC